MFGRPVDPAADDVVTDGDEWAVTDGAWVVDPAAVWVGRVVVTGVEIVMGRVEVAETADSDAAAELIEASEALEIEATEVWGGKKVEQKLGFFAKWQNSRPRPQTVCWQWTGLR